MLLENSNEKKDIWIKENQSQNSKISRSSAEKIACLCFAYAFGSHYSCVPSKAKKTFSQRECKSILRNSSNLAMNNSWTMARDVRRMRKVLKIRHIESETNPTHLGAMLMAIANVFITMNMNIASIHSANLLFISTHIEKHGTFVAVSAYFALSFYSTQRYLLHAINMTPLKWVERLKTSF